MPLLFECRDIARMRTDAVVSAVVPAPERGSGPSAGLRTGAAETAQRAAGARRHVIRTAGPLWEGGLRGEERLLRECWRSCLAEAERLACASVAFPPVLSGAPGWPQEKALAIAVEEVRAFLNAQDAEREMTVHIVFRGRTGLAAHLLPEEELRSLLTEAEEARAFAFSGCAPSLTDAGTASRRGTVRRESRAVPSAAKFSAAGLPEELEERLRQTDEGFSAALLRLIDQSGRKDSECYRAANVSRQVFSRIRSDPRYQPSRSTALAFAVALRLDRAGMEDLLRRAGYALSPANGQDIVVGLCIDRGLYDIDRINMLLYDHDLQPLG